MAPVSGVVNTVGKVVGVVASVAAMIPGPHQPIAAAVSVVASAAVQLTQPSAKKPVARGSVSETIIQSNAPTPYLMGRTYSGGTMLHQVAYGPTLNKVPNPYLSFPVTYSGCGPVEALEQVLADFTPVSFSGNAATGYLGGFLHRTAQLGTQPSPAALAGPYGAIPGWPSTARLSGHAAILFSAKFDKDGKVFASGLPQLGAVWRGVKVYDPRQDSTYPGGSGSQRWADEATWAYSENPGLHALAYARGRYSPGGKKLFGIGLPQDGIIVADFVSLANVCDANGWKVGGVIYEPANRWENLKDILVAGGAEPAFAGARLGLKINMPRVAVDRITDEDLATDDVSVGAMQSWRERLNGIVPRWRSEAAKWEYVPGGQVTVSTYLAEDGEEKVEERQYNLVQQQAQAAQLAAYDLVNARELGPIEIVCRPRMRRYRPGTLVTVHLPDDGLVEQPAVIVKRDVDPATMAVSLTLMGETAAKHDFALGRTGTPPPTPTIVGFEELDDVSNEVGRGPPGASALVPYLTNETHQLPATFDGTVLTYAGAETDFRIFEGASDITDSGLWTLTVLNNPQQLSVTLNGRRATVTGGLDAGEDRADLTLRALGSGRFADVALDQVFSLTKSKGGADGAPARLMRLDAAPQQVRANADGSVISPAALVTLTATKTAAGTARTVWRLLDSNGAVRTAFIYADQFAPLIGAIFVSDDQIQISAQVLRNRMLDGTAGTGGQTSLIFETAFDDDNTKRDRVTVYKVADGANGLPGQDGYTARLTAPAIQVPAYADGTLKPNALQNANGRFELLFGETSVNASTSFSVESAEGGSITIDADGDYTVTSVAGDFDRAIFNLRADRAGVPPFRQKLIVTKQRDGDAAYSRSVTGFVSTNSTTYVTALTVTVPVGVGMGMRVNFAIPFYTIDSGTNMLTGKLSYQIGSGAFTDIAGSEASGSVAQGGSGGEPGTITLAGMITDGALPDDATITVRAEVRKSSSIGGTISGNGRITATWAQG